MKKITKHFRAIIAIAIMLCVALPTFAHDFEVNGIFYRRIYDNGGNAAMVTYAGSEYYDRYNEYQGFIEIPSSVTYNGISYPVTAIEGEAFRDCVGLKRVTIPSSVTSIGNYAFMDCTGLTEVNFNAINCDFYNIFKGCSNLITVNIGNSVKSIPEGAFMDCVGLKRVTIPSSVTSIGEYAFMDCTGLTEVNFNAINCKSMGSSSSPVFKGCLNIKTVNIGNAVESIPNYAFYGCTGLTEVNFNAISCKSMGSSSSPVFKGCSNIKTVNIGNAVESIPNYAFYGCTSLTKLTIGNSVTTISDYAFYGCDQLSEVTFLPTTPPSIPENLFPKKISKVNIYLKSFDSYKSISLWDSTVFVFMPDIINNDNTITGTISFSGSGSGTETDPYLIFNPVQLNDVRNSIGHSGVYYKLMNDIDMSEWIAENNPTQGWQPIGNEESKFKGTFIGNGKKITGITISRGATDYVGLFGYLYNATVSDLTVEGQIIGNNYVGGIAGKSYNSSAINSSFNGNVIGNGDYIGGIVGSSLNDIYKNCSYFGDIKAKDIAGGFAGGFGSSIVNNSLITGNISGTKFIGGFAGIISENGAEISNITVLGNISSTNNSYIGGCFGIVQDGVKISSALHKGEIKGIDNIGGIIGYYITPNSYDSITNCKHIGKISGESHVGGIIGSSLGMHSREISNSYAIGEIYTTGNYCGGLVGYIEGATTTITDSYFSGAISGNGEIGGLLGSATNTTIKTSYSNASLVKGETNVGGIAGYMNGGEISSCVAINEKVNASKSNVGRIYGSISGTTIGTMGTVTENKAMATSTVSLNGVQQYLEDGPQHGTNVGKSTLKLRSTYQGIGWDWTTNWDNQETESFPYKQDQTAPPVFTNTSKAGDTTISGKSIVDGTIYVEINDKVYTTTVANNSWSITVDSLQAGSTVVAYAKAANLNESFRVFQVVKYAGSGTDEDPYQIYTANDLANVNGAGCYKLMNDIDLTEWIEENSPSAGWIPLGRNGSVMTKLIGDNHKITGLWINSTDDNVALIASAQNLTITDLSIEIATGKEVKGGQYTAGIVGNATNCTISNCHVKGVINGTGNIGGVAGTITNGAVSNSSCDINITTTEAYAGGICGQSLDVAFENCNTTITAIGGSYLGGITGTASQSISNCRSAATLNGTNYIGGLVGKTTGTITRSYATCNIEGADTNDADTCYTGGLAGYSAGNITISHSEGNVSQNASSLACYVGGISGYNDGATIENCYSTATVSSSQYAAGIAGYNTGSISNCYASGDILATLYGAGIVGYNDGTMATTKNCIAANNILSVSSESGIAMRIIGGIRNNAPVPESNNYALKTMAVSVNGVTQKIYDDVLHGIGKTQDVLMQNATYSDLGWDMVTIWGIEEGKGYPFIYGEKIVATSISLDRSEATLAVGDTLTLNASILPKDASIKSVKWTSSNDSIAMVDDTGVVTAVSAGNAVITSTTIDGSNLSATCSITVFEEIVDYFTSESISVNKGASVNLPISMVNEHDITAFQCDVYLPEGISIVSIDGEYDITLSDRAASNHVISSALQADGAIRVLCYSTTSRKFSGNEGALFNLPLIVSDDAEGNYSIKIDNIEMSSTNEVAYTCEPVVVDILVKSYLKGDANGDSKISVTDIVAAANYVLGSSSSSFLFGAADVNEDSKISVTDIVGIANLILSSANTTTMSVYDNNDDVLSVNDFNISAGETKTIAVNLKNNIDYTAFQMDLVLPNGLNIKNCKLTNRASGHNIVSRNQSSNTVRVLSYSILNANYKENDGELLILEIEADKNFIGGNIDINNAVFVENNETEHLLNSVNIVVGNISDIESLNCSTKIYSEGSNIIIESPIDQSAGITLTNGMTRIEKISVGKMLSLPHKKVCI